MNNTPIPALSRFETRFSAFVGIGLIIFSVIISMLFYSTFVEGFVSFVYASGAILLDLAGILMLHFIGRALAQGGYLNNEGMINLCAIAYVGLFAISLLAAYGYYLEVSNVGHFIDTAPDKIRGIILFILSPFFELMGVFILYHRKRLGL